MRLVRGLLLFVIAVVLVEAVVGVLSGTTGVVEKAIILGGAAALISALPRVWRVGAPHAH